MSRALPDFLPKGGHFEESGSEYVFECPQCGGHNFHWNLRRNQGWCFNCELKIGSPRYLIYLLKGQVRPTQEKQVSLESNISRETDIPGPLDMEAALYLAGRGVSLQLSEEVGFKYSPATKRIYAPIWSPFIRCPPSWKSRSILPGEKGWMSMKGDQNINYLFGADSWPKSLPQIVLVEGVFDVLTPGLWGRAWALLGSNLGQDMEYWLNRQGFLRIVLLLDPDAGEKAAKIEKRLRSWGNEVLNLTGQYPEPGSCRNGELDFLK